MTGNPNHWFGSYYLAADTGTGYILYNSKEVIKLKAKDYTNALKEAKNYELRNVSEK